MRIAIRFYMVYIPEKFAIYKESNYDAFSLFWHFDAGFGLYPIFPVLILSNSTVSKLRRYGTGFPAYGHN